MVAEWGGARARRSHSVVQPMDSRSGAVYCNVSTQHGGKFTGEAAVAIVDLKYTCTRNGQEKSYRRTYIAYLNQYTSTNSLLLQCYRIAWTRAGRTLFDVGRKKLWILSYQNLKTHTSKSSCMLCLTSRYIFWAHTYNSKNDVSNYFQSQFVFIFTVYQWMDISYVCSLIGHPWCCLYNGSDRGFLSVAMGNQHDGSWSVVWVTRSVVREPL